MGCSCFQSRLSKAVNSILSKKKVEVQKGDLKILLKNINSQCDEIVQIALKRKSLKNSRIDWKFLYIVHQIMFNGSKSCIDLIQELRYYYLLESSNYEPSEYSVLQTAYCNYLKKKLDFHVKYKEMPGNFKCMKDIPDWISQDALKVFEAMFNLLKTSLAFQADIMKTLRQNKLISLSDRGRFVMTPSALSYTEALQLIKWCRLIFEKIDNPEILSYREEFNQVLGMAKTFDPREFVYINLSLKRDGIENIEWS